MTVGAVPSDGFEAAIRLSDLRLAHAAGATLQNLLSALSAKIDACSRLKVFEYEAGSEGHLAVRCRVPDPCRAERGVLPHCSPASASTSTRYRRSQRKLSKEVVKDDPSHRRRRRRTDAGVTHPHAVPPAGRRHRPSSERASARGAHRAPGAQPRLHRRAGLAERVPRGGGSRSPRGAPSAAIVVRAAEPEAAWLARALQAGADAVLPAVADARTLELVLNEVLAAARPLSLETIDPLLAA